MKKTKVIFTLFLAIGIFFIFISKIEAVNPGQIRQEIKQDIQEIKKSGSSPAQIRQEIKEELQEKNKDLLQNIKNKVQKNLKFSARIKGIISSVGNNVIAVTTAEGKIFTVNITNETKLKRKFWGNLKQFELGGGHTVYVVGKWTDEEKTTVDAQVIKDESIQKRWGVFFGKVTVLNTDNFVIETVNRGSQSVYFDSLTKFFKNNMEAMTYDQLVIGHKVRVSGTWDSSQNKIIEVELVKDFSLGKINKGSTPSATPTE